MENKHQEYAPLLAQLSTQLNDLSARCKKLDQTVKQTENQCFVFDRHLFSTTSLTLIGYIEQIDSTLTSLQNAITNNRPEILINHECERYVGQFQVLLKLVQGLEKGDAALLYKSYSSPKEQIFQQLQKQYQYEHRLLDMIAEQEERLPTSPEKDRPYIKEKVVALKLRYQKCNTYTQKLEFKLEDIQDE